MADVSEKSEKSRRSRGADLESCCYLKSHLPLTLITKRLPPKPLLIIPTKPRHIIRNRRPAFEAVILPFHLPLRAVTPVDHGLDRVIRGMDSEFLAVVDGGVTSA